MTTRRRRPQSSPSPRKKTPQRGSQKAKTPHRAKKSAVQTIDYQERAELEAQLLAASEQSAEFINAVLVAGIDCELDELAGHDPELKPQIAKARARYMPNPRATAVTAARAPADATEASAAELLRTLLPSQNQGDEAERAQADADRRAYFRRSIEDFSAALRTAAEPDAANIAPLAEAIAHASALLRETATCGDAHLQEFLSAALCPAARAAVALTDFVNGPCHTHAAEAHAEARARSERWPRIHHANATQNAEADNLFKSWKIGADRPRKPAKQTRPTSKSIAFDCTLDAMLKLLPDALRPGVFPVLPSLLDESGEPIPPRARNGALAMPYLELARFIVTIRHTPRNAPTGKKDWNNRRAQALNDFLNLNDAALERQPRAVSRRISADYKSHRERIVAAVQGTQDAVGSNAAADGPPPPFWLRPTSPSIGTINKAWSRDLQKIIRPERLKHMAVALHPAFSRTAAEIKTRAALRERIALLRKVVGKGKTGRDSADRDYVERLFQELRRLNDLREDELHAIEAETRAENAKLQQASTGRQRPRK